MTPCRQKSVNDILCDAFFEKIDRRQLLFRPVPSSGKMMAVEDEWALMGSHKVDMDRNNIIAKVFSEGAGWWRASTDWMKTGQSIISHEPVSNGANLRIDEFSKVSFLHPPWCACCGYPFEHEEGEGILCGACLAYPPAFGKARSPLIYSDTVSDLVLKLKRQGRRAGLNFYAKLMYDAGREMVDTADLLIPVPLHYKRLVSRGFNQAGWLASALSRLSGAPVKYEYLKRVKASQSQGHLSPQQRKANVAGAFAVPDRARVKLARKRIVLIDDVYTTGATVEAAVKRLNRAGAANVDVLTLARVVRPKRAEG